MSEITETDVWSGCSSHLKYLGLHLFALALVLAGLFGAAGTGFLAPLGIPVLIFLLLTGFGVVLSLYAWVQVRFRTYRLTTQRLLTMTGLLSRRTETLELYRVRDIEINEPFLLRLYGLQNIELRTSDPSTPFLTIDCIPSSLKLLEKIREHVEDCRVKKNVRELDLDVDHPSA